MPEARILIVEDEGIEALDIQNRLKRLGYAAEFVSTGEDAVARAEETRPDLVLMDIMLPGAIDGVAAAEQIRARLDIPVIYLTAYADEATLQRAKISEPYGYLVKPFKERELHITIDMALYKHQMERRLKESERWLATTLRSIGDAVMATDPHGLITFMNPVAENLTGWKLEELAHRELSEGFRIINRETRQPAENPVAKVLKEGTVAGLANHTRLIARDGSEIPIDDSAAPIRDDQGNIIGVILVFRDITEREKAEEALRQAKDELETRVRERTAELEAEVAERKRAEKHLKESEKQLRYLSSEIMAAQEKERKRIAGELHDSVAASLSAVKFMIEKIAGQAGRREKTREEMGVLISRLQQVIEETRRIMSDLRPSVLDDLGVVPAIQWFCREFEKTYGGIEVAKQLEVEDKDIPDALRTPIFRICQEALNNVRKHSKATSVNLALRKTAQGIELRIGDNGQGFDPQAKSPPADARSGLGLMNMRERAELSGGEFAIQSAKAAGTAIRVTWPT